MCSKQSNITLWSNPGLEISTPPQNSHESDPSNRLNQLSTNCLIVKTSPAATPGIRLDAGNYTVQLEVKGHWQGDVEA